MTDRIRDEGDPLHPEDVADRVCADRRAEALRREAAPRQGVGEADRIRGEAGVAGSWASQTAGGGAPAEGTAEQLSILMHELHRHEVALERQNDELRAAQAELERSRDAYADLYDFAPVGYVTLDQMGIIREANLTMAQLVGVERGRLLGHPMVALVNHRGKNPFVQYLQRCREADAGEAPVIEVQLRSPQRGDVPVQLRTAVAGQPGTCRCHYRMAVMDVSEHKRDELRVHEMARFPAENPSPVMRAHADGTLMYANAASAAMLEILGCDVGMKLPGVLREQVVRSAAARARAEFDLEVGEYTYSVGVSPSQNGVDVSLYLRDVTSRKRAERALAESREDLNRAQAVAHVGSWRLDVRANELRWSDENHRIFGLPPGTPMSYETFLSTVHPDDRAYVDERWQAALAGEPYDIEHRIVVDGAVKWVRELAELEFDDDGSLRGGFGTTQDITEKKHTEQALRKLNETLEQQVAERTAALQMLHDIASVANLAHDVSEALEFCLRRVAEHYGWSFGHVLFPAADDPDILVPAGVWHAADATRYLEFRELTLKTSVRRGQGVAGRAYRGGETASTIDVLAELDPRRAQLAERLGIIVAVAFPVMVEQRIVGVLEFYSEKAVGVGCAMRDAMLGIGMQIGRVIERKAFQDRLLTLAEEEHRRIGRELHDDVGQELAGLALQMETLAEMLGKRNDATHAMARKIVDATDRTRRKCRALSRGLLPAEMAPSELGPSLADLASRTQASYDVSCRFQCDGKGPVSDNQKATQLYRIAREAVANAVAHGQARSIEITLATGSDETMLTIRDDGVGVPPESERGRGMGLQIMEYRAGLIGGRLEIASSPGDGTSVVCRLAAGPHAEGNHSICAGCPVRNGKGNPSEKPD